MHNLKNYNKTTSEKGSHNHILYKTKKIYDYFYKSIFYFSDISDKFLQSIFKL